MNKATLYLFFLLPLSLLGQTNDSLKEEKYTFHFQQTVVGQYHPVFNSPYAGRNSLQSKDDWHTSLTATIFTGMRLWKGGEFYFNPEIAGGSGLSGAFGVAGFVNGETFRVGNPSPTVYVARGFFRQHIALGDKKEEYKENVNQVGGRLPADRLTFTIGKICMADIFDCNSYSHDARSQLFNWALMDAGAWDYPANVRGYTYSFVTEYIHPTWTIRAATSMVPEVANGPYLDMHFDKAHSETLEIEKHYSCGKNSGVLRVLVFTTTAHMGNYRTVLDEPVKYDTAIVNTRAYGRRKSGFSVNWEQGFGNNLGAFVRASWNDGKNETWAFTEIDQSLTGGIMIKFSGKKPDHDSKISLAFVVDGLSNDHRDYLKAGGYGFIIGDGKLNYANEMILEAQYNYQLNKYFFLSPDYQFVMNPAYNKDRGPVNVVGLRGHIEF